MFALESDTAAGERALPASTFRSRSPIRSRIRYEMRSAPQFQRAAAASPVTSSLRSGSGRIQPPGPRAGGELARLLPRPACHRAPRHRVLPQQPLRVHLEPPLLGRDSVDEFLFDTKQDLRALRIELRFPECAPPASRARRDCARYAALARSRRPGPASDRYAGITSFPR